MSRRRSAAGPGPPTGAFQAPHRLSMGLSALAPDEPWLQLDDDWRRDLAEKRRLLRDERAQVWVEEPSSRPAQAEVLERVAGWLAEHAPGRVAARPPPHWLAPPDDDAPDPAADADRPPLARAARCVQEDLVVMEERGGQWVLSAAAVCFPTRWDLPSKLGRSLASIHDPVPGYAEELARPADRFFDGLRPDRIFWRSNWSLLDDPALFLPVRPGGGDAPAPEPVRDPGHPMWVRIERQTLLRLPRTGATLFTIRIHREPLARLRERPAEARALAAAVRTMDPALRRYKGMAHLAEALAAALPEAGAPSGPGPS